MTDDTERIEPFDPCGPLPSGTLVLEASAGTGKTYTIAALATRYLAEGVSLDQLMMVTFSRAATSELRVRVRARLVETAAALRRVLDTADPASAGTDPVTGLLATGEPEQIRLRLARLTGALAEFDEATIATTHEFCARMLNGLGVLSRVDPGREFTDSLTELVDQVTADVYLSSYADRSNPPFDLDTARWITRMSAQSRAPLVPVADPGVSGRSLATERVMFASAVREEVRARQVRSRLFSHDDILYGLRDSLSDPLSGDDAVQMVRERYRVVLVDEFQDTDPVQWEIVRRAFHGHATLILIGDPKQAIYAFRGADVHAYLDAVGEAGGRATLDTNWRSDGPMVAAVDHLFAGAALGDPRIRVRPVTAHHTEARIRSGAGKPATPVRLRVLPSDPTQDRDPRVGELRPVIRADLVGQVVELLQSDTMINHATTEAPDWQPIAARDIAVLVQRNDTAERIVADLAAAGVPAVLAGSSTVFTSETATDWLTLLEALVDPRSATIRRAALTPMLGWDFATLATATDDQIAELSLTIRQWSQLATHRGIAALLEAVLEGQDLPARLLSQPRGERLITDLRHIGQLLHDRMSTEHIGLAAVTDWLAESIARAKRSGQDEQSRRLETDAEAIQVITVHRSKGLEFGVVLLPEVWDRGVPKEEGQVLSYHEVDPATGRPGALVLDVGGGNAGGRAERRDRWRAEEAGEDLRLLYVALTRARHQVIAWWAPSWNTNTSPLHRVLYGPREAGVIPPPQAPRPSDPDTLALDGRLVRCEAIADVDRPQPVLAPSTVTDTGELTRRRWQREIDLDWRRTSYSALTAAAHEAGPAVHDELGVTDETSTPPADDLATPTTTQDPVEALASPMGELPAGTEFGTIMHAIYEHADATAEDLPAELLTRTRAELARTPYPVDAETLATALVPAFRTPLGPIAGGRRLSDVGARDRLSELDFELPLAGGDRPSGTVRLAEVADLLAEHLSPGDPLADYPALLAADPTGQETLRGFLTGSIDSVLRLTVDGQVRHLVVDYKSNWLGDFEAPLTVAGYRPDRLAVAMMRAHYPLQALLYAVALHRYLGWRLPGYDPAQHLGGIAYLFVRGMAGPDTPTVDGVPYGVFAWDPGPELVVALSELLAGAGGSADGGAA